MEHPVHMPESEYIYKILFTSESMQNQFQPQDDALKSENAI